MHTTAMAEAGGWRRWGDTAPLPHHMYELPTPYDAYGAAGTLLQALE